MKSVISITISISDLVHCLAFLQLEIRKEAFVNFCSKPAPNIKLPLAFVEELLQLITRAFNIELVILKVVM